MRPARQELQDKSFRCLSLNGFAGDRTLYGMEACQTFSKALSDYLQIEVEHHGETETIADLNWDEALVKSNKLLSTASELMQKIFNDGFKPILITPRCATAIATLPQVMTRFPDCIVVYLDAHGDVTTPTTSTTGYLGGMPITAAMGVWDSGFGSGLKPSQLVHIGGRDFDDCEIEFIKENNIMVLSKQQLNQKTLEFKKLIADKPVYIHIDTDVYDPSEVVAEYAVPDGLYRQDVHKILTLVQESATLVGLEITEFSPKSENEYEQSCSALFGSLLSLKT